MIKSSSLPAVKDTGGSFDTRISFLAVREELRRHRSTAARKCDDNARRDTIAKNISKSRCWSRHSSEGSAGAASIDVNQPKKWRPAREGGHVKSI